jgi:tRNA-dihydrouridine synthase B
MSGVTNRTMRALYKPFGLGLTVTEFVSSNALKYANRRTMEMIDQHGIERPVSTQLWGDEPQTMAQAARLVRECGADIVDINFGCPAPKVTKTNGGSACLRDPERCEAIVRAVVDAVDCPVTVKMRLGWTEQDLVYIDVAKRAQNAGARAITLHARTARQFYKGSANWDHIAR